MSPDTGPSTATRPDTVGDAGRPSGRPFDPASHNPLHRLTDAQIEELGERFQALHDEVKADLGERTKKYKTLLTPAALAKANPSPGKRRPPPAVARPQWCEWTRSRLHGPDAPPA